MESLKDLIEKAKSGNELAFKQLIESIIKDLYRIAYARLDDEDDINDAIQNTMIITYKNIKKQKNIEFFKTYTIRVLINECNKIYNSNKLHIFIKNKVSKNQASYLKDSIESANDRLNFENMIKKLDYKEQLIITLFYNSNYSCKQIAKILKMNENTVKSKILRARKKIKDIYEEVDNDE